MSNVTLSLFGLAIVALIAQTLTLFAKKESIRGAGRVSLAVSLLAFGAFLVSISSVAGLSAIFSGGLAVMTCGVVTLGSGVRKYIRRNLSAA